jgi:hypothetical protein
VKKVLDDMLVEGGYSMILRNDADAPIIVAADKNLDITERVVARLRTVAAAKPAATPLTPPKPAVGAPASAPSGVTRPKPPGT